MAREVQHAASMLGPWLLTLAQVALAALLRAVGHMEGSGVALTLALAMVGWLLAEGRGRDR